MKTLNYKSNSDLKSFLLSLTEEDFKGTKTKSAYKKSAKMFMDNACYGDYERLNGSDVHHMLLCLVYDNI